MANGWTTASQRSQAAPALNQWIANQLGAATGISISVYIDEVQQTYTLDDFGLQAIDLLYLIHPDPDNPNSPLVDLITYTLRTTDSLSADVSIRIDFTEEAGDWPAGNSSIYQLQPKIAQLKELLSDAKPLSAEDLSIPVEDLEIVDTRKQDLAELVGRIGPAKDNLLQLKADLDQFLLDHPEEITSATAFAAARDYLWSAFHFGLPNAISNIGIEEDAEAATNLLQRVQLIANALAKKESAIIAIEATLTEDLENYKAVMKWIKIGKEIFGQAFPVIPKFDFDDPDDLTSQLGTDPNKKLNFTNLEPLSMDNWLQGMSKVRKKMGALEMQRLFQELSDQTVPALQAIQLPFQTGDYWLGIDYPDDHQPAGDKLSLITLESEYLLDGPNRSAGLILDEWTELIPNKEEVSGISFNYDQPDAVAPQSLLLAVSPTQTGKWDWDDLIYTLIDTLELAKNRAVEPDHLEQSVFGQILPAVVAEVVPPQVAEDGYANPLGTQVVMDFMDNLPPVEQVE